MGSAAPRFLFILRHNLRLLFPSFSSHFHHHRTLFSSFTRSPSSFTPKLKVKLKASQHQHQHIHTQPSSSSLGGTHPWPEFSKFLSHISSAGYTSTIPPGNTFPPTGELSQADVSACLTFARDRPNLLRLLSMRDIAVVVEHGIPFMFSDSDDSVWKMKSFVSNGDSTALDTDKANMVDLMKFMLSYASNCLVSSERNSPYNRSLVESSVRNLFGELFKLSYSAPGPNSFDSEQNQMTGGRFGRTTPPGQNIEMKRGDWICPRCNFMNFARNIKCLECEEARPKRQLTGGEWECPQCDFHNYGRNVACLRCDCKRPGQISLGGTNTTSHPGYVNGDNSNASDIDARLVANEEKAQRWFNKVSQLDNNFDINSVVDDEDFPEIMPLRKGVNRFVVSTRKTPLENRLTNAQFKKNLGNNDTPGVENLTAWESAKSHDTLDDIRGRSTGLPQSDYKNMGAEQNFSGERSPSIANNSSHFKDVKGNNTTTLPPFPSYASSGDTDGRELSNNSTSVNVIEDKEKEQAEKSDSWFKKIAELNDVPDITSAISDDDFPEIMPMRKGENRFVVSKKKDRSLTTPAYKRRLAMEQSANTNFVPFVPFPPDYFAKKDKPQADGTDSTNRSNVESSSISKVAEMSSDARFRPEQSPKPSSNQSSSNNNHVGSTYAATSSGNSSQGFNQDHVPNLKESSSTGSASEHQSVGTEWTGKSLEGSAVREPDPLDMSEEAKAERWFRRVAQIKDISELSQIPDEDFPSIMPMRKGVNRFVVSKRKTPLERRLTSQQYRRNLPVVSSDPVKRENEEISSLLTSSRNFCSRKSNPVDQFHGPAPIDYSSLLQEGDFHRLSDSTIHSLQEKFEDYGDSIDLDGFDVDYGNDVLTVKLGELGTYVLNKQTPNRQLWLSSPVSGPSRFDWDQDTKAWIYRRNKAKLYKILEDELEQLCGKPIVLS